MEKHTTMLDDQLRACVGGSYGKQLSKILMLNFSVFLDFQDENHSAFGWVKLLTSAMAEFLPSFTKLCVPMCEDL